MTRTKARKHKTKKDEISKAKIIIAAILLIGIVKYVVIPMTATYVDTDTDGIVWLWGSYYTRSGDSPYDGLTHTNTIQLDHGWKFIIGPVNNVEDMSWSCYPYMDVYHDDEIMASHILALWPMLVDIDHDKIYVQGDRNANIDGTVYVEHVADIRPEISNNYYIYKAQAQHVNYRCAFIQYIVERQYNPDTFDVVVSPIKSSYFEGETVPVKVTVTNQDTAKYKGTLTTTYLQDTFYGIQDYESTQNVVINQGENEYLFYIPTEKVTDKFDVAVSMNIIADVSGLTGVNVPTLAQDGKIVPVEDSDGYLVGNIEFPAQSIKIDPLPLTMPIKDDGSCDSGYTLNPTGDQCVAEYVKDLSCYHLGCPMVDGKEYQCTSAGVCAETVYVTTYGDCPSGTSETYSDKGEKICIKTELYEEIVQCSSSSDCMNPCDGITSQCNDNKCEYIGECEIITEERIVEIIKEKEKIIQCSQDSDCIKPCDGITSRCVSNICDYSGVCDIKTETEYYEVIKEIEKIIQCNKNSDCVLPCNGMVAMCEDSTCKYMGTCVIYNGTASETISDDGKTDEPDEPEYQDKEQDDGSDDKNIILIVVVIIVFFATFLKK